MNVMVKMNGKRKKFTYSKTQTYLAVGGPPPLLTSRTREELWRVLALLEDGRKGVAPPGRVKDGEGTGLD